MSPLLELRNISYAYHTLNGETLAVDDISFCVHKGEFIALIGPSGCGKSTLLSLIAGLIHQDTGEIFFRGTKEENEKQKIGYMLQRDYLLEWRTIYKNIILGLEIQHKLNDKTKKEVERMLEQYGLSAFRNSYPGELSGGMRQRAALIRTLAVEPELLLLDEPFSALDFQTRLHVCDDISRILRAEHKTVFLVTHDLSEAVSMADRVIVLSKRPTHVKKTVDIQFENKNLTPFEKRNAPEFKKYFNVLWEELNGNEEE